MNRSSFFLSIMHVIMPLVIWFSLFQADAYAQTLFMNDSKSIRKTITSGNDDRAPNLVFQEVSTFGRYQVSGIEIADLNLDGKPDLILASEENNSIIQVYENLVDGVFRNSGNTFAFQSSDQRHWNFGISVADFNGDGLPDFATADAWAGMNIYFNRGEFRFEWVQNFTFPGMGEVKGIAAADLDHDGFVDIILGDHNGSSRGDRVLINDGTGILIDSGQSIGWDITWDVFAVDINRDGAPDYISINRYAYEPTRVHINDGRGVFTKTVDIPDGLDDSYDIKCFAHGDYTYCFIANSVNGRGRLNRFAVFDKTGELIVNRGFGEINAETKSMCLVDLNSDGLPELVTGNYNGNSLAYFFRAGDGGMLDFSESKSLFAIPTTSSIGCGDFNGDGLIDLVIGVEDAPTGLKEYHLLLQQPATSCAYTISTTSHQFNSESNAGTVTITSSPSNCTWAASSNDSWITVTAGGNGAGNSTVAYNISANMAENSRTGTMTIGGQTFTVIQGGTTPYVDTVQKAYIGYYQRPADPGGLIYWVNRLDKSGGNLADIIAAYANSDESRTLYGTVNSSNISTVINNIYLALFNRDADAGGRDYYIAGFNSGQFTAATIMLNVLRGAQNDDLVALNNKLTAANLFTRTIDPELDGGNLQVTYAGDGDVLAARNFLNIVTWNSTTVPTQAQTKAYIRANIADSGDAINADPPSSL